MKAKSKDVTLLWAVLMIWEETFLIQFLTAGLDVALLSTVRLQDFMLHSYQLRCFFYRNSLKLTVGVMNSKTFLSSGLFVASALLSTVRRFFRQDFMLPAHCYQLWDVSFVRTLCCQRIVINCETFLLAGLQETAGEGRDQPWRRCQLLFKVSNFLPFADLFHF